MRFVGTSTNKADKVPVDYKEYFQTNKSCVPDFYNCNGTADFWTKILDASMYPDTSGRLPMSINHGYCAGQFANATIDGSRSNLLGSGLLKTVCACTSYTTWQNFIAMYPALDIEVSVVKNSSSFSSFGPLSGA